MFTPCSPSQQILANSESKIRLRTGFDWVDYKEQTRIVSKYAEEDLLLSAVDRFWLLVRQTYFPKTSSPAVAKYRHNTYQQGEDSIEELEHTGNIGKKYQ